MAFDETTTASQVVEAYKDVVEGKNIVITGVSPMSMGAEYVAALAAYAGSIIIATRSIERAEQAISEARRSYPQTVIRIVQLDLTSGPSIHAAAAEINSFQLPVHILVNNAIVVQPDSLVQTKENFEIQIGGNHFGHFLFTSLIFSIIMASRSAQWTPRIVNLTSAGAFWGGAIRWDDMHFTDRPSEYSKALAYNQSKTANALFTLGLVKNFPDVVSLSVHPGLALGTNVGQKIPKSQLLSMGLINEDGTQNIFQKSNAQAAATALFAAFDPTIASHNGALLSDCNLGSVTIPFPIPEFFNSSIEAEKLWAFSEEAWKIKFGS
ncbi:NAD(P)-binding protein [Clavulina sp. PMI_390]|nr:NAD(P)-binding protein [Clavulina sp. PMI_390]